MTNGTEVIRSETIHRLGVDIELYGDGQGFFHIVYKVEDRYGEHITPLVDPIRCPIRAAEVYERELNLVHRARH